MAEADIIISVPTFKLWMGDLPMSLSLKNLFGCYGARYFGNNKTSHELAKTDPRRTLQGEVGIERGIHHPSVEHSIAAMNLTRPSDLTVIDAIEGSDSKGNYVQMDILMVGKNAVAADAVALAVAGFVPEDQEQIRLCSQMGLDPGRLDQIEVVGESIEEVQFTLGRLNDGILELPIPYCLDRLSLGELQIIGKGLKMHGFLSADATLDSSRTDLIHTLLSVTAEESYFKRALACLPDTGLEVLALIKAQGGTSGD